MDISEVSKRCGVPSSTLRYYEERGLIRSIGRKGLRRLFGPEIVERLALIAMGTAAGLSLDEIARMFGGEGERPKIDRKVLAKKADDLDARIARLAKMRDGLRHAAACPHPSHFECPTFRRLLHAAMTGAPRSKGLSRRRTSR